MTSYSVARQPYFCWDDDLTSKHEAERGVLPVEVCAIVLYAYKTLGNSSSYIPFFPLSRVLIILSNDRFVTSSYPLACGWVGEE